MKQIVINITDVPHCSFCGKSKDDVKILVKGNGSYICNECIEICIEILEEKKAEWGGNSK